MSNQSNIEPTAGTRETVSLAGAALTQAVNLGLQDIRNAARDFAERRSESGVEPEAIRQAVRESLIRVAGPIYEAAERTALDGVDVALADRKAGGRNMMLDRIMGGETVYFLPGRGEEGYRFGSPDLDSTVLPLD